MPQENVEVVRQAFEAFQEGLERDDQGALFDSPVIAPDAEWIPHRGFPRPPSYRGREGFVEFWRAWTEEFEDYSIEIEQLIDASNDRVVAFINQSGTGTGSGALVEARVPVVVELEGGRVVRMWTYLEPAEALEAVGLRK